VSDVRVCEGSLKLDVYISPGDGQFQVCESNSVVASGRVTILTDPVTPDDECSTPVDDTGALPLSADDIYKELRLRGYDYGPTFHGVLSADGTGRFDLLAAKTTYCCMIQTLRTYHGHVLSYDHIIMISYHVLLL